MNRVIAMFFSMALAALPLCAQSVDFGLWAVSPELQGDNRIDDASDLEINFDEEIGWAVTADIFWTPRLSTEVGIYSFSADGSLDIGGILDDSINLGALDIVPITLTLRAHFGGERFDFYVGAGGAYATFDDLESDELRLGGVEFIEIDDEFTWLANAGLSIRLTQSLRLGIDAKWIPLEVTAIDNLGLDEVELELDPLLISGGVIFRF
ncbi:MAG TPA: OmpW family outer membrane protein [Thermoanaerobaculia bacterium]|nr:OmpW family outer membrane protein [Thermoanaerobaculia bacterium]